MVDWGKWISTDMGSPTNILDVCVGGPVSVFEQRWPGFMQQHLHPKIVAKVNKGKSLKTSKNVYHAYFHGLLHSLGLKGWEVTILARAGGGYVDIRLISKTKASAVLIELKSSEYKEHIGRYAGKALQQIVDQNYRNHEGLRGASKLREFGIASYHLSSCVKGRYLELNAESQWEEKQDPAELA
jgi:hypothetical protein